MPDRSPAELRERQKANRRLPCSTPGCSGKRASAFGTLCGACQYRKKHYGNPQVAPNKPGPLPKSLENATIGHRFYASVWPEVDRVLVANRDHPAVREACRYIEDWMYESWARPTGPKPGHKRFAYMYKVAARRGVRRLDDAEVEPFHTLQHVAAAYTSCHRNPFHYDDAEPKQRAIGSAMLKAIRENSRDKSTRVLDREVLEAGRKLWALPSMLLRIALLCDDLRKREEGLRDMLKVPLNEPST